MCVATIASGDECIHILLPVEATVQVCLLCMQMYNVFMYILLLREKANSILEVQYLRPLLVETIVYLPNELQSWDKHFHLFKNFG